MTLEKFTIGSLSVLALMLFIGVLTQGTSYVNFFLIEDGLPPSQSKPLETQIVSCDTVYLKKVNFLTAKENSLQTSLEKLFSIKTPRVSGLYSPFYKSNLTFQINENPNLKKITLNLIGDLKLLSECQAPYIQKTLANSIQEFYPEYKYDIQLNGSSKDYLDLIQPVN